MESKLEKRCFEKGKETKSIQKRGKTVNVRPRVSQNVGKQGVKILVIPDGTEVVTVDSRRSIAEGKVDDFNPHGCAKEVNCSRIQFQGCKPKNGEVGAKSKQLAGCFNCGKVTHIRRNCPQRGEVDFRAQTETERSEELELSPPSEKPDVNPFRELGSGEVTTALSDSWASLVEVDGSPSGGNDMTEKDNTDGLNSQGLADEEMVAENRANDESDGGSYEVEQSDGWSLENQGEALKVEGVDYEISDEVSSVLECRFELGSGPVHLDRRDTGEGKHVTNEVVECCGCGDNSVVDDEDGHKSERFDLECIKEDLLSNEEFAGIVVEQRRVLPVEDRICSKEKGERNWKWTRKKVHCNENGGRKGNGLQGNRRHGRYRKRCKMKAVGWNLDRKTANGWKFNGKAGNGRKNRRKKWKQYESAGWVLGPSDDIIEDEDVHFMIIKFDDQYAFGNCMMSDCSASTYC